MTERNPLVVIVATLITCTLYGYYWLYETTDELQRATGRDLNPAIDVVLTIVTFGLWAIYAMYRNSRIVHEELVQRGCTHEDRSMLVLLAGAATFVSGFAWLVSMAIAQDELNKLAREVPADRSPYRDASFATP